MFIIFDTNIWVSELALNTASGAAVRFFVQECGATVVLPEIVRLELQRRPSSDLSVAMQDLTPVFHGSRCVQTWVASTPFSMLALSRACIPRGDARSSRVQRSPCGVRRRSGPVCRAGFFGAVDSGSQDASGHVARPFPASYRRTGPASSFETFRDRFCRTRSTS